MLGETVHAPEAERVRLISQLCEEGHADERGRDLAWRLAGRLALAYV